MVSPLRFLGAFVAVFAACTPTVGKVTLEVEASSGTSAPLVLADGWSATFSRFIVSISAFTAKRGTDHRLALGMPSVVSLTGAQASGVVMSEWDGVPAETAVLVAAGTKDPGGWDFFDVLAQPAVGSPRLVSGASNDDAALLVGGGYTVWVEGTLSKAGSADVAFRFISKDAIECLTNTFMVLDSGTELKVVFSGEQWFRFAGGVDPAGQWLADSAANLGGAGHVITTEDLGVFAPSYASGTTCISPSP